MKNEINREMIRQAQEKVQDAEQYLNLAVKNLECASLRLQMVQSEYETTEEMELLFHKADQVRAVVRLTNQAHDGVGIAADFAELGRSHMDSEALAVPA